MDLRRRSVAEQRGGGTPRGSLAAMASIRFLFVSCAAAGGAARSLAI
jgi:hypothetical protein